MTNPLLIPELREMLKEGDISSLKEFCEELHPKLVAELISGLEPNEIWAILLSVNNITRAEIFSNMEEEIQIRIISTLKRQEIAKLLSDMPPDDRVDLIKKFPEPLYEAVLPAMAQAEREDIRRLIVYKEGTAGAVMTSDYATLPLHITAAEAIDHLRSVAPDKETIYYAYVVDENRTLLGFVSLKDLILAPRTAKIEDLMHRDVIYARVYDDQEEAARKIQQYDLLALPVIDENNSLVGIITHDDAFDIITQEHTEDMEKFMAIAGSHQARAYLKTPTWIHFKNRVYWLVSLAAIGLISGIIIHNYEHILSNLLILALYMPMVADTGGNTGSQSATVVVRALALGEIRKDDYLKVIFKEFKISILLGIILGFLAWIKVLFLSSSSDIPQGFSLGKIAFTIAVALGLQVITATMIGAILPLMAVLFKKDPAVIASPALTTIVDITGLLIYFFTAKFFLGI
ncbi:MAG: magnesium transporter [Spirochaetes bacterium]|nr:magnesium transporter [Spirochaetota bacterium]